MQDQVSAKKRKRSSDTQMPARTRTPVAADHGRDEDDDTDENILGAGQPRTKQGKEQREANLRSQHELRQRKKLWASFPQEFQDIFKDDPAARSSLLRAPYFRRGDRMDTYDWSQGAQGTAKLIPVAKCTSRKGGLSSDAIWDIIFKSLSTDSEVTVLEDQGLSGLNKIVKMPWLQIVRQLLRDVGGRSTEGRHFAAVWDIPLAREDVDLHTPASLGCTITDPALAKVIAANLGFAGHTVNFHIDSGYAGLAALAGDCEKIWLLAPPTVGNVEVILHVDDSMASMVRELEDLVVVYQTPEDVMWLPPGTIHATFTVKTGWLYGSNFNILQNVIGSTRGLSVCLWQGHKEDDEDWSERHRIIDTWISLMRAIRKTKNITLMAEAIKAFREQKLTRRRGIFGDRTLQVTDLAKDHYPECVLRDPPSNDKVLDTADDSRVEDTNDDNRGESDGANNAQDSREETMVEGDNSEGSLLTDTDGATEGEGAAESEGASESEGAAEGEGASESEGAAEGEGEKDSSG